MTTKPINVEVEYYTNSKKIKAMYEVGPNGQKNGLYLSFYRDGGRALRCHYKDGQRHGSFRGYHPNGRLAVSRTYENGRSCGDERRYYASGRLCYKKTRVDEVIYDESGLGCGCGYTREEEFVVGERMEEARKRVANKLCEMDARMSPGRVRRVAKRQLVNGFRAKYARVAEHE